MSSWGATYRRIEAAQRREQRAAQRQRKELERRFKENEKLSALEQARLEVETHENSIDLLLSVHKEQSLPVDWVKLASALPPHQPPRLARHEMAAHFEHAAILSASLAKDIRAAQEEAEMLNQRQEEARRLDDKEYETATAVYATEVEEREKLSYLAGRVLAGESRAYTEALSELSPFEQIESLGSSIHMTVHNAKAISCELKVNGRQVVPSEIKGLTVAGTLSLRPMPKARVHEIYQDHVCACALRLAREMFALLPVETIIVTAIIDGVDSQTGNDAELPVLSLQITRAEVSRLDFTRLDPSDAVEALVHRGDVKVSRKTGQFVPVEALTPDDVASHSPESMDFGVLLGRMQEVRSELMALLKPTETNKAPDQPNVQDA
jgi:hypothetical protein